MTGSPPSLICRLGVIELNAFYRNAARAARGLALANTAVTVPFTARTVIRNPSWVRNKYFSV